MNKVAMEMGPRIETPRSIVDGLANSQAGAPLTQSQTYFSQIIKETLPCDFIRHLHFKRDKKGLLA